MEGVVTWAWTFNGTGDIVAVASTETCVFSLMRPVLAYIEVTWAGYGAGIFGV
jgi:hypothetical protein